MSATAVRPTSGLGYGHAPNRTLEQRRAALKKANDIRHDRAILKRDLGASRRPVIPVLVNPPEFLETMKVYDLLLAVPRVGRVKAGKLLKHAEISPSKTVGGLSPRQRRELAGLVGGR